MNAEHWNRVQTLFKEIVDLEPDTRHERLESVKTEDPILYEELRSLLAADSQETSLLDGFAIEQVDLSDLIPLDGVQVGPFQIEKQVGSGGMGSVYLARRVEGGFDQTVALKLIKYGMGTEQAIRRFEDERSILARLQHPHIARLIDGGITHEGRPWFAMDYVEGETLTHYCKRLNLPLSKRLELFYDVTEAVQYAHKNLVIHRDLKPGNILVTGEDEKPQVKLLDFGIARILEESDTEDAGMKAMTRAYASPEQLRGESTSTATDIYSLGVVLYELITGCHPNKEYRSDDCKPTPVPRELKAVCHKAMQPDTDQRYENVSELGDDILAWLEDRPVFTYSRKPLYRINKWMNRNRAASFISIFSLVAVIVLIFVYTEQLKKETTRAQDEAMRATRIASVLGSSLRSIDPVQNRGQELTARGMVDMSTNYINNELKNDPRTRAELLILMADIYANLIVYDVADSLSAIAVDLYSETEDTTSYTYISMLSSRSVFLDLVGKYDEGLAMMHHALDLANQHLEPLSLEFAGIHLEYTYHLGVSQEYALTDSILRMVEPIYEQNREEAGETYDHFIFYKGTNYRRTGDFEKAKEYLFRSLELGRARYPEIHEHIAMTLNHISSLYQNMGEYDKALPYAIEAHEMRLEIFGPGHLNTIAAHANTARTYIGAGRLEEAAETYRDVVEIFRNEYGNENFYIGALLHSYGSAYLLMEDYERAESIMRESMEHSERLMPADHIRQASPLRGMADALRGQNRFGEALPFAERAYQILSSMPDDNVAHMNARFTLGFCLWGLDRREEAETHFVKALALYRTNPARFANQIEQLEKLGF
ncbi:MAG: serine/threonine protein kinase [Balneolaceae bacterium]|nr:MAG: serine/threonine protein kinase [Balneolaceae bacterium]